MAICFLEVCVGCQLFTPQSISKEISECKWYALGYVANERASAHTYPNIHTKLAFYLMPTKWKQALMNGNFTVIKTINFETEIYHKARV